CHDLMGAHDVPPWTSLPNRRSRGGRIDVPQLPRRCSLEGFQEGDEVADLVCVEAELRHGRMSGDDTFCQRFLQGLHGITFVQSAERWGDLERARAYLVNRMAPGAVGQREAFALLGICCCDRRDAGEDRKDDGSSS